jgi:hypothetical protein
LRDTRLNFAKARPPDVGMATDRDETHRYGPRNLRVSVQRASMTSVLILFDTLRELAPWALMLIGSGGMAAALRMRAALPVRRRPTIAARRSRLRWTKSS